MPCAGGVEIRLSIEYVGIINNDSNIRNSVGVMVESGKPSVHRGRRRMGEYDRVDIYVQRGSTDWGAESLLGDCMTV